MSIVGIDSKNPPKFRFKKFVKLSDDNCSCNDLTNFEYQVRAMTGNGNCVKVTIVTAAHIFPINTGKLNGEMFENSNITTTKPSFQLQKKFRKFREIKWSYLFLQRFDKF